jgi:hypothetical protein
MEAQEQVETPQNSQEDSKAVAVTAEGCNNLEAKF